MIFVGEEGLGSFNVLLGRKSTERGTDKTSNREIALEAESDRIVVLLEPTPEVSSRDTVASKTSEEVRNVLKLDFVGEDHGERLLEELRLFSRAESRDGGKLVSWRCWFAVDLEDLSNACISISQLRGEARSERV